MKNKTKLPDCPLRKALVALGGKWNLIIIKTIGKEELRYGKIKREIPDISEKVLIEKIKVLVTYNIVIRKNFNEVPPRVSYRLSKTGIKALKIIDEMVLFGNELELGF